MKRNVFTGTAWFVDNINFKTVIAPVRIVLYPWKFAWKILIRKIFKKKKLKKEIACI